MRRSIRCRSASRRPLAIHRPQWAGSDWATGTSAPLRDSPLNAREMQLTTIILIESYSTSIGLAGSAAHSWSEEM